MRRWSLTYRTAVGRVANELLDRHDEPREELVEQGRPWGFDGDGALFRLVSEAQRIRLAHLFGPVLAVHVSVRDRLPQQITAVYEAVLPRQPLRFLLADDPGAGKTLMAGLLTKELIDRGDLQRSLAELAGRTLVLLAEGGRVPPSARRKRERAGGDVKGSAAPGLRPPLDF